MILGAYSAVQCTVVRSTVCLSAPFNVLSGGLEQPPPTECQTARVVCVSPFKQSLALLCRDSLGLPGDPDAGAAVEEPRDHRVRREEKHLRGYHVVHAREEVSQVARRSSTGNILNLFGNSTEKKIEKKRNQGGSRVGSILAGQVGSDRVGSGSGDRTQSVRIEKPPFPNRADPTQPDPRNFENFLTRPAGCVRGP